MCSKQKPSRAKSGEGRAVVHGSNGGGGCSSSSSGGGGGDGGSGCTGAKVVV